MSSNLARAIVYRDTGGAWRWRLLAPNKTVIAHSAAAYTHKRRPVEQIERYVRPPYERAVEVYDRRGTLTGMDVEVVE